jgi:Zn-dependent M16 (insulinase) family peptidase
VVPYIIATRPNPALLKKESDERLARAAAETRRLMAEYQVNDEQQALQRYKQEYDAKTVELDKLASQSGGFKFIEHPPLTLDDQLEYQVSEIKPSVKLVASSFENMTSSTTGLALRLDGVAEADLFLLTLLPNLLTQTGVIIDGKPVSYEEMQQMLRKEILGVSASFSTDLATNRAELVVQGAGNDLTESRRAIEWMQLVLHHPDWRPENLPRIRDLVEQQLSAYRNSMQGAEERWVRNPVNAYYKQTHPLYLSIGSFLTGADNVDRLRWMLKDTGTSEDRAALSRFLTQLAKPAGEWKSRLNAIEAGTSGELKDLTPRAREVAVDVAKDLDQLLPDLPQATLASDLSHLCNRIREDLAITPEVTLRRLDALRASLLRTGNARLWMVGSSGNQRELGNSIEALVSGLETAPHNVVQYSSTRRIDQRLREHQPDAIAPRFVGLYSPNLQGGVFNTLTPGASYHDTDRESLLRFLTRNLFAGGGAHSVFTKTIGAGLAYSNGIGGSLREGTAMYYAERMPDVSQTLHFVIDTVRRGPRDPGMTEYVISGAFRDSYAADPYEVRAKSMADDLADGITPEVVKRFRQAILQLRKEPDLAAELFKRVDQVYGPIVPGFGVKAKEVSGAVYYLIGNEKQFQSLDGDVQNREDEHVYKLYPRDYWLR